MRAPLSVVILTKNEEDRLPAALASVAFADEVVVADTGSTDATGERARLAGARFVPIGWDGFVGSRNRALALARHDWVLVLDADERVSEALRLEILAVLDDDDSALGGLAHAAAVPLPRAIRSGTAAGTRTTSFASDGGLADCAPRAGACTRRSRSTGSVGRLVSPLIHHPYRDLSDALRKASRYAQLGAEDRYDRGARGSAAGLFLRPAFEFFRFLVFKRGFLDGAVGWSVAFLHASSYFLRAAFLLEIQRRPRTGGGLGALKEGSMNVSFRRALGGALAVALVSAWVPLGLPKKGSLEKAGAAADKAIEKAKDAAAETAKSYGAAAEKAMDKAVVATKDAADKAATATKEAAASAAKATSTAVAPVTKH